MAEMFEDAAKTEFNSGIAIIYRLDTIHKNLHSARVTRDYSAWFEWLIAFFMELSRFLDDKTGLEYQTAIEDVKNAYFSIQSDMQRGSPVAHNRFESFYTAEVKLTKLEQKNGLGMSKKDLRFAMAGQ